MNDREFGYNPYYYPENCGLEKIAEIEYSDSCYQFDTRVVWRDIETGCLYTASDSGCSCPTPFEDYKRLSDLDRLFNTDLLRDEIKEETGSTSYEGDSLYKCMREVRKVEKALAELRERCDD